MAARQCASCRGSFRLADATVEPLTAVDKAICAKHDLDFTTMKRVTCPLCGAVALAPVTPVATRAGGPEARLGTGFACSACGHKFRAPAGTATTCLACPKCKGIALSPELSGLDHILDLAQLGTNVARLRGRAFDSRGPLYTPERHRIFSDWMGNVRHNLEAAIKGFAAKIDAPGDPISETDVRAGLRRMCDQLDTAQLNQRMADVCSPAVAREMRAIFDGIRRVASGQPAKPVAAATGQDGTSALDEKEVATHMRRHIARVMEQHKTQPAFRSVSRLVEGLTHGPKLAFAARYAVRLWPEASKTRRLKSAGKSFPDCYVGIDVVPETAPERLPSLFGSDGYIEHLSVFDPGRIQQGQALAAWCYCHDGTRSAVHLSFLGPRQTFSTLAQDLMTNEDRRALGL